jgi:putative metal-binding protein
MAGARRAIVLALASLALLGLGSAAAEASVTHNIALQVHDEQGKLAGSFTGTLRFDGPRAFAAHVCLKDELKDGRGPYFHFEYLHTDGSHLVGRTFRNSDGAGSTVCHDGTVNRPPDIDGMWLQASVDELARAERAFYDNPFASAPPQPVDNDGDGFTTGQDCNDADPAIHPGAVEVRGNAVDENCDGRADDLLRIGSGVTSQWIVRGRRVTLSALRVRRVPKGAAVTFRCFGKRCPVRRTKAAKPRRGRVNVLKRIRRVRGRFRAGQTLEVRVTAPDRIGKVVRYPLKAGKAPTARVLCLRPGMRKPQRCS